MRQNKLTGKIITTAVLLVIGLCSIFPFIFMVSASFKPSGEVLATPFQMVTANFTLGNFDRIFNHEYFDFMKWYSNTVIMTGLTLGLKIFIITATAYGFAKIKFPGNGLIFLFLLAALMIPGDIMIMPRYLIFKQFHILNTMWAVILPSMLDVYFVFLLRQSFLGIPESLSEAAKIDGCGHYRIYWQIVLPLSKAAIATMLLFSFVWVWNDYMGPYLYISDINRQMLSVGIKLFAAGQVQDYGAQMAAATVVLLPIIIIFFFCQKYFVEGVTSGAVKG